MYHPQRRCDGRRQRAQEIPRTPEARGNDGIQPQQTSTTRSTASELTTVPVIVRHEGKHTRPQLCCDRTRNCYSSGSSSTQPGSRDNGMRNGEGTMVDAPGTIVFATATLAVQRSLTFGMLETVGPGVACMRAPREGSGFAVVYARVLAAYVSARPVSAPKCMQVVSICVVLRPNPDNARCWCFS